MCFEQPSESADNNEAGSDDDNNDDDTGVPLFEDDAVETKQEENTSNHDLTDIKPFVTDQDSSSLRVLINYILKYLLFNSCCTCGYLFLSVCDHWPFYMLTFQKNWYETFF